VIIDIDGALDLGATIAMDGTEKGGAHVHAAVDDQAYVKGEAT
jgi:hypothetical protein